MQQNLEKSFSCLNTIWTVEYLIMIRMQPLYISGFTAIPPVTHAVVVTVMYLNHSCNFLLYCLSGINLADEDIYFYLHIYEGQFLRQSMQMNWGAYQKYVICRKQFTHIVFLSISHVKRNWLLYIS